MLERYCFERELADLGLREYQVSPKQTVKKQRSILVALTVIGATRVNGDKNWASIQGSASDVVVEATTSTNNKDSWKKIRWSRDSGESVPGKPNQRKLTSAKSKHYHVVAKLGGVEDHVDVWVLWASVTILTSGIAPNNSAR